VLSSVGFSSPPAWLRPYRTLSNGEQFRSQVARLLIEPGDPIIIDEFTSVVDRTVARIGASAIAGHLRKRASDRRLVVASCHEDIVEWLQPDWLYETGGGVFTWRSLQPRPRIRLEIYRTTSEAWRWFGKHHYLSDRFSPSAYCLVGCIDGQPAALSAAIPQIGFAGVRRESRIIVMPDFQGIGVGNKLSEFHAAYWKAKGFRFRAVASHPAVIGHRARSSLWWMDRTPTIKHAHRGRKLTGSDRRLTASFEYIGPALSGLEARTLD
jgi:GNAT superfamily N-acetyltransferase